MAGERVSECMAGWPGGWVSGTEGAEAGQSWMGWRVGELASWRVGGSAGG